MTRKEYFEKLAFFKGYCETVDIHHKPVKGEKCNFGAAGYSFQGEVGVYLGFVRGQLGHRKNSSDNRCDFIAHGLCLEVKHNCSNLDILYSKKKVDYVCYCPDYIPGDKVELVSYVMSKANFITVLETAGLVRKAKKATDGTTHIAMQSYKNSKKKYNLFLDLLEEYNEMSLADYKALLEERKNAKKAK